MQEKGSHKRANRLIHEKSLYLLQHAYNPVDWYPWSEEAFAKAKAEDKPVFVSIGYSTCHWCHVMEKECFEDGEVAERLNNAFVSIKIDREERPDLDSVYMTICQIMGRNCGWPLNIVMTPERNSFFAASYIPKARRLGSVGMMDLIPQIAQIWRTRRAELENLGAELRQRIEIVEKRTPENELGKDDIENAYRTLLSRFDAENGGFGRAPKFPTPHNLLFLLRYWNRSRDADASNIVTKTLDSMRAGGIFDQLGFGFHRYSTDGKWLIPHFEKMLYDQALLTLAYLEAYQVTGSESYKSTAEEVLEYVLRDLTSPEGGFFSAEDADSEGKEGKFYVWTAKEIQQALLSEDADLASRVFGITSRDNFSEPGKNPMGENVLHLTESLSNIAAQLRIPANMLITKISQIQKALYDEREKRKRPARDEKILTDWNGLMIAALAKASRVLNEPNYLEAAKRAVDFAQNNLKKPDGTLWHRYAKGESAIEGFLDDYAFFAWGLLEVYETSFEEKFKKAALETIEKMLDLFWDEREGGFNFTSRNSANGLPMQKQLYDGAMPSGNSVALQDLLLLSRLNVDPKYEEIASRMSRTFAREIRESPAAHSFFLSATDLAIGPAYNVILVGNPRDRGKEDILDTLRKHFLPNVVLSLRSPKKPIDGYRQIDGKATAYVCRDKTCFVPTNEAGKVLELLGIKKKATK